MKVCRASIKVTGIWDPSCGASWGAWNRILASFALPSL